MQIPGLAGTFISHARRIPRKVWIGLAASLLLVVVLMAWLAVAVVSRGWTAASELMNGGLGATREQLLAVAPEVGGTLERGRATAALIAPGISEQLERVGPQLQQELGRGRDVLALVAPGAAERLDARVEPLLRTAGGNGADVPGEDIDGVPRHPAMARTGYSLADGRRTVTYAGPAAFAQALAAHRDPLLAAGFSERILQSSSSGMTAEYQQGARILLLTVTAKGPASSEVQLAEG